MGRAFLLRVAVAVALSTTGLSQQVAPDEVTYFNTGLHLSAYWSDLVFSPPQRLASDQPKVYFYLNGISFFLFGSTFPLKVCNALLGALLCRYVFLLSNELYGAPVARIATLLCAYFPSLVLWSAVNIRDVWVVFLLTFISWRCLQVVRRYSNRSLLELLAAVALLTGFRQYLFIVVAIPPLVALLIGGRGGLGRNFLLAGIVSMALVFLVQRGSAEDALEMASLEALAEARAGLTFGAGSAFETQADISTPLGALRFLPVGVAYFLFSPFPWQITTALKAASLPEMLFLYWLTPSMYRGVKHAVTTTFRSSLQILLLTALLTVSYALGSGNVGTLYRHRAQALPFLLTFAALGLQLRRDPRYAVQGVSARAPSAVSA